MENPSWHDDAENGKSSQVTKRRCGKHPIPRLTRQGAGLLMTGNWRKIIIPKPGISPHGMDRSFFAS
jgi:hypothetical protein